MLVWTPLLLRLQYSDTRHWVTHEASGLQLRCRLRMNPLGQSLGLKQTQGN